MSEATATSPDRPGARGPAAAIDPRVRIGHVHLKVSDLPRAEGFWLGDLGFELMHRYGNQAAFVATGGYHHHVGLNTWMSSGAPLAPPDAAGLERVVFATDAEAREARDPDGIAVVLEP